MNVRFNRGLSGVRLLTSLLNLLQMFEKAISTFPYVLARIDPQSTCANSQFKSTSENLEKSSIVVFFGKSVTQEIFVRQNSEQ